MGLYAGGGLSGITAVLRLCVSCVGRCGDWDAASPEQARVACQPMFTAEFGGHDNAGALMVAYGW